MADPVPAAPAAASTAQVVTTSSVTPATPTAPATQVDTSTTTVKDGHKTTEFGVTVVTVCIGALMDADVFAPGSTVGKICGAALIALGMLGYQYNRTKLKLGA